jgi:RNA polymerase sigma-70 factor (ECF subfamily)
MSSASTVGPTLPSFKVLYEQHYAFVWRSLVHFGLDEPQADDASQDVFIVVHRRLPDFDGRTHLRSWLFGIARRVARGYQRGELRRQKRLELVAEPAPADGPDEQLQRARAVELVDAFLASLEATQRDVFYLSDVEGLTAPEIADALGVKLNTVYSRLRAARKRFERAVSRQQAKTQRRGA